MNKSFKRHLLFSLLLFTFSSFISNNSLQAQDTSLPDGWCHQPSDVQLDHYYYIGGTWTIEMGVAEGGIHVVYQDYNRSLVLLRAVPREAVKVLEEDLMVRQIGNVRYSANCRYLLVILRDVAGRYNLAAYDLLSDTPGRMGTIRDAGRNRHSIDVSPDGNFVFVTSLDGLYLWNLDTNMQLFVTALVASDCGFASMVGCSGELATYREARWDVTHGLVQLDLISNVTVTLNLPSATINRVEPTYPARTSQSEAETRAVAFTSRYACNPLISYQTFNHQVVLTNWLAPSELIAVVENNLDLSGFQALGWSATCRYIAAAIEDARGIRLAVWNVETGTRQDHPISDWVDSARWSTVGDVISVRTDGEQFEWNVSGE